MSFIPVNQPLLDGNEESYLLECLRTGWVGSEGPFVRRFEEGFANAVGRAHGIAVSSGSAALDVAVAALQLAPGDEVIMPAFTIISCAASVVRAGAVPVLVDSDPLTWNMRVDQIEARISARTRAVMVVHIYGLPVDMGPVLDIARRHGLAIVEDAAQMHGQTWRGRPCGSFGQLSVFSFYPNKQITTGEGGMVVTDDATLAERCRGLRNLCFRSEGRRFVHDALGWNYRMTNLQAALGLAQLERMADHITRKRAIGHYYQAGLGDVSGILLPLPRNDDAENIYWVFGLVLDDEVPFAGDDAAGRLAALGIGTRPFFWPMHEQPVFRAMGLFCGEHYPVAERLARRGFYLPSGLGLERAEQDRVIAAVQELFHA